MGPGKYGRVSPAVCRMLAGIETGILGGLAMFGWLALAALMELRSIWTVPNLLGSVLYGKPALERGFSFVTLSGLGLHLFVAGLVGMLFGLVIGDGRTRVRVVLLGVLTALVWYYFSQGLFWRKLGAFVMVYSPPRTMLLGHVIYGLVLGWFPTGLRSIKRHIAQNTELVETPETGATSGTVE